MFGAEVLSDTLWTVSLAQRSSIAVDLAAGTNDGSESAGTQMGSSGAP